MEEYMKQITYYQNILDFKEKTKSEIHFSEVNNWNLCRTCMTEDINEKDLDIDKSYMMDMTQGIFLSAREMIKMSTQIKIDESNDVCLPSKVCQPCLNKISNLYFFSMQISKAEKVLIKLAQKLGKSSPKENHKNFEITVEEGKIGIEKQLDKTIEQDSNQNILQSKEEYSIEVTENPATELDETKDDRNEDTNNIYVDEYAEDDFEEIILQDENNVFQGVFEDSNDSSLMIIPNKIGQQQQTPEINENQSVSEEYVNEFESEQPDIVLPKATTCIMDEYYLDDELEKELSNVIKDRKCNNDDNGDETNFSYKNTEIPSTEKENNDSRKKVNKLAERKALGSKKPRRENRCAVCLKVFLRQQQLVQHAKQIHPNGKAFSCAFCQQTFSHRQSMLRHMSTHEAVQKKITCKYCSKEFIRVDDIKRHQRIHTGERPYACSICGKSFKQLCEMKAHSEIHSDNRSYKCNMCDRVLTSRNGLYLHKKSHMRKNDKDVLICQQRGEKLLNNLNLETNSMPFTQKSNKIKKRRS